MINDVLTIDSQEKKQNLIRTLIKYNFYEITANIFWKLFSNTKNSQIQNIFN